MPEGHGSHEQHHDRPHAPDAPESAHPSEHGEPHEHPGPIGFLPVLPTDVFAPGYAALDVALGDEDARRVYRRRLSVVEEGARQVDSLAGLARGALVGEWQMQIMFAAFLTELSDGTDPAPEHTSSCHHGGSGDLDPTAGPTGGELLNAGPVIDAFLAVAFTAGHGKDLQDRCERLRAVVLDAAARAELVHELGKGVLDGTTPTPIFLSAVRGLGAGMRLVDLSGKLGPFFPSKDLKLPGFSEHQLCVMELLDAVSGAVTENQDPLSEWMKLKLAGSPAVPKHNARITGITPPTTCAGAPHRITIEAAGGKNGFDVPLPSDVGVYFAGCVRGAVVSQTDTAITVEVPEAARSGPVSFLYVADAEEEEATTQSAADFFGRISDVIGSCPSLGLQRSMVGPMGFEPRLPKPCPSVNFADHRNEITVRHRPVIWSFSKSVGGSVEPCSEVMVSWEVRSDDAPVSVALREPGKPNRTGLPLSGSALLQVKTDVTVTLEAESSCGKDTQSLSIPVVPHFSVSPRTLSLRPGESAQLVISRLLVCDTALDVPIVSSDSSRVSTLASATIPAGAREVGVTVIAHAPGVPLRHAAEITLGHGGLSTSVEVWVENPLGSWEVQPDPLPLLAIHAALLRTGKVLFFAGDEQDFNAIEKGASCIWDPRTGAVTHVPLSRNLFCAGHCQLPDGRLLVAGGHVFAWVFGLGHGAAGIGRGADRDVHTFDPQTETWTRHADMEVPRWYPSCITSAAGRALIIAGASMGSSPHPATWLGMPVNRKLDVFDGPGNRMTHFASPELVNDWDLELYPLFHVLPGNVWFLHARRKSWLFFPVVFGLRRPDPIVYRHNSLNSRNYPLQGASVVLPLLPEAPNRVRVLGFGGGDETVASSGSHTPATATAEIFDFDPMRGPGVPQPGWRRIASMGRRRFMSDGVLMADGTVLAVGGAGQGVADANDVPVVVAELFDPVTETWRDLAAMTVERRYHSVALLLPDGRVVSAGSTGVWPPDPNKSPHEIEIFSPPYLSRGPRPFVTSYPTWPLSYGERFSVGTPHPEDVERVALVRAGSTTHTLNTDQRWVGLSIREPRQPGRLEVTAPPDGSVAPPGFYMLFLLSRLGVPSVGEFVQLS